MLVLLVQYYRKVGAMLLTKLEGIVPNRRACFDLLCLLENEYNCSIKLWLDANNPRGGEIGWTVYAAGSGFVWDHSDLDCYVGRSRVLDSDGGNVYPAIWSCLRQLADKLGKMDMSRLDSAHPLLAV